jgi:alkaline phosphatase D
VIHHLGDDVTSEIVAVPGMIAHVLDEVIDEVYPRNITAVPVEAAE